jgi:hypothetical protein
MDHGRQEERSLCADLLKVRWKTESGASRMEYATLEDISSGGACLQLEEPIPPGTPLVLFYPSGSYRGRVKYCDSREGIHLIGMEFDPGYRWSRRQYKPSHLLQFRLAPVRNTARRVR